MQDLFEYTSKAHDLGVTVRFSKCPFCGKQVGRAGFIVTKIIKGHVMWCHSCHAKYFVPTGAPSLGQCLSLYSISRKKEQDSNTSLRRETQANMALPRDAVAELPIPAQLWLGRYGVTQAEVSQYKFYWSASYKRLILPVHNSAGQLIYWQGRYFGNDFKQPKYLNISTMRKEVWFDTETVSPQATHSSTPMVVVLVEDILSAIAVRRSGYRAIALLGSYVSNQLILKLSAESKQAPLEIVVWLDPDKLCESIKSSRRLKAFGMSARSVLRCPHDPKECNPKQIRELYIGGPPHEKPQTLLQDIMEPA